MEAVKQVLELLHFESDELRSPDGPPAMLPPAWCALATPCAWPALGCSSGSQGPRCASKEGPTEEVAKEAAGWEAAGWEAAGTMALPAPIFKF